MLQLLKKIKEEGKKSTNINNQHEWDYIVKGWVGKHANKVFRMYFVEKIVELPKQMKNDSSMKNCWHKAPMQENT